MQTTIYPATGFFFLELFGLFRGGMLGMREWNAARILLLIFPRSPANPGPGFPPIEINRINREGRDLRGGENKGRETRPADTRKGD